MTSLSKQTPLHFIGICGTAMGSVAVALKKAGFQVSGSDEKVYPPMSTFLEEHGIEVQAGYSEQNLPAGETLCVIGNAISRGNPELEAVLDGKHPYISLPEALKYFLLRGRHNLVVAGTHGKTTTSALLAWIFEAAGKKPSYMIGGLPGNLGQGARFTDSPHVILEGDEYNTAFFDERSKFMHYLPELVIVNNVEFDHADIFDDLEQIKRSFRNLVKILPRAGMLLLNADDPHSVEIGERSEAPIVEVGFSPNAANRITELAQDAKGLSFQLLDHQFEVPLHGVYNARNAAMAISAAHYYGISLPDIARAVKEFQGVRRRQEVRGEVDGVTVVDDFAHHPTAIREALEGMRHRFPGSRLWAVFEPRSNTTRRSIFQKELAQALGHADGAVIAAVARAELLEDRERLDPALLVRELESHGVTAHHLAGVDEIVELLSRETRSGDVVVVLSNGGFEGIHQRLLKRLERKAAEAHD